MGVQVAIVIGGGTIFRGVAGGSVGMDRPLPITWACWHRDERAGLADAMNKQGLGRT